MLSNHSFNALSENARRAAAARQVPAGDDGSAEAARHRAVALPAVQSQALHGGADSGAAREDLQAPKASRSTRTGLKAIARAAEGSMRDGLSLLDQSIAFGGGKVEGPLVAAMLGSIDREPRAAAARGAGEARRRRAACGGREARRERARLRRRARRAARGPAAHRRVAARRRALRRRGVRGRCAVRRAILGRRTRSSTIRSRCTAAGTCPIWPRAAHGLRDDVAADVGVSARRGRGRAVTSRPVACRRCRRARKPRRARRTQSLLRHGPRPVPAADRAAEASAKPAALARRRRSGRAILQTLDLRGPAASWPIVALSSRMPAARGSSSSRPTRST